jgi:hypothetical protein
MSIKALRKASLVIFITAVLCAGSLSARQLQTKPKVFPACTGTCSATKPCLGGCICQDFGTTKACVRDPGPVKPIGTGREASNAQKGN